jgi:predicted TIM-barrel fold metal-dependent hydrolase
MGRRAGAQIEEHVFESFLVRRKSQVRFTFPWLRGGATLIHDAMSKRSLLSRPKASIAVALFVFALSACARPVPTPGAAAAAPDDAASWRRTIPIIDVHGHIDPDAIEKTLAAMDANFIARMVNLTAGEDAVEFAAAQKQFDAKGKGRFILYVNDVYTKHAIEDPSFGQKVGDIIEEAVRLGAKGLKISKTLGLYWRDAQNKIIAIDDPRLEPMWSTCARLHIPISIHSGDPKAFWLPVDPSNERYEELKDHPKWAFGGGEYPPREAILRQLERVVASHPEVTFVGVHFGNDPEDVDHVAALMRKYRNYNVDIAARVPEIGRQDPGKLRALFVEFQDRILFGTDFMVFGEGYILGAGPVVHSEREVKTFFDIHFRFLETNARQMEHPTPIQGRWKINAIGLPRDVLEKVYFRNAERIILKQ